MTTDSFCPLDDLILFCLDTLCPCDLTFITNHVSKFDSATIEKRLNSTEYWENVKKFKKIPLFIFEIIFILDGNWVSRSLAVLTSKRLLALECVQVKTTNQSRVFLILTNHRRPASTSSPSPRPGSCTVRTLATASTPRS